MDNNNNNGWNVTFIFLYSTELLCFNLKTNLSNTSLYCCLAVRLRKARKDRLDHNIYKKNQKQDEVWCTETSFDIHKENQHPMGKEESR